MEGICSFTEGMVVGKVKEFKTEEEFKSAVREEYGLDEESDWNVERRYCRWYVNPPYTFPDRSDFPDGCYVTCDDAGRGAFEVFIVTP